MFNGFGMEFAHAVPQILKCFCKLRKDCRSVFGAACDIIRTVVGVNNAKLFSVIALFVYAKMSLLKIWLARCNGKNGGTTNFRNIAWWMKLDSSCDSIEFVAIQIQEFHEQFA